MTDREIVDKLLAHDQKVTRWFFFESCRPLILSIIKTVYSTPVSYAEAVSDIYHHLMEDDGRRLRQFDFRSSIYTWIKPVAARVLLARLRQQKREHERQALCGDGSARAEEPARRVEARMDVERCLAELQRRNPTYAYVMRRVLLEDAEYRDVAEELRVRVSNLYNIKKRALDELASIVKNQKQQ